MNSNMYCNITLVLFVWMVGGAGGERSGACDGVLPLQFPSPPLLPHPPVVFFFFFVVVVVVLIAILYIIVIIVALPLLVCAPRVSASSPCIVPWDVFEAAGILIRELRWRIARGSNRDAPCGCRRGMQSPCQRCSWSQERWSSWWCRLQWGRPARRCESVQRPAGAAGRAAPWRRRRRWRW